MLYFVICDYCQAKMRSRQKLPLQARVKCAQCGLTFGVAETNQRERTKRSAQTLDAAQPQKEEPAERKILLEGAEVVDDDDESTLWHQPAHQENDKPNEKPISIKVNSLPDIYEKEPRTGASRTPSKPKENSTRDERHPNQNPRPRLERDDDDARTVRRRDYRDSDYEDRPLRPSQRSRRYDDDYDDRPRRVRGRWRSRSLSWHVPAFIAGGVVLALFIALGLYIGLRGVSHDSPLHSHDSPVGSLDTPIGSLEGNLGSPGGTLGLSDEGAQSPFRPRRTLSKAMFHYYPNDQYSVVFNDHAFARELGSSVLSFDQWTSQLGVSDDGHEVAQAISFYYMGIGKALNVHVRYFNSDFDLAAVMRKQVGNYRPFHESIAVDGVQLWTNDQTVVNGQHLGALLLAFQPNPRMIVYMQKGILSFDPFGPELAAELIRRAPDDNRLPDEMWRYMQEVSGYPSITAKAGVEAAFGLPGFRFELTGDFNAHGVSESVRYNICSSASAAKELKDWYENLERQMNIPESKTSKREQSTWIRGNNLYHINKYTKLKPQPALKGTQDGTTKPAREKSQ